MRILVVIAAILSMPAVAMACDVNDFMKNVAIIKNTDPPFRYSADYPDYHRPEPHEDAAPQERLDLLRQVFEIAPPYFQQRLCRLTGLFIVPGAPWGYREHPSQFSPDEIPERFDKYIGMPGLSPPGYEGYETVMLEQMLHVIGIDWSAPRIGVNKEADIPAMTVLAAIAHEDGHIKFRETYTPTPGTPFDFNRFCDGSYFRGSWADPVDVTPADKVPVKGTHLAPDVQLKELFEAAKSNRTEEVGKLLMKMFRSERWVTLIGAASPEHDWVETYKVAVLLRAKTPLRQMKLQTPGSRSIDMIKPIKRNTEIAHKLACFNSLFGE